MERGEACRRPSASNSWVLRATFVRRSDVAVRPDNPAGRELIGATWERIIVNLGVDYCTTPLRWDEALSQGAGRFFQVPAGG